MFDPVSRIWTVEKNDWLTKIAQAVYCDLSKWNIIAKANKEKVGSYNYDKYVNGKYNIIYPGQKLYCPLVTSGVKEITSYNSSSWFVVRINGKDVQLASSLTVDIQFNNVLRTARFSLPYTESINEYKQYDECQVFIKGKLVLDGFLIRPSPSYDKKGGNKVDWEAVTSAFDICKSNYNNNALEGKTWKNISLQNLCSTVLSGFDVSVDFHNISDRNIKFDKVSIDSSQTIFDFLRSIFEMKGLFLYGLSDGNMVAMKNSDYPKKVLRFYNETENITPTYNYDELAQTYRAIETKATSGKKVKTGSYKEATNDFVSRNIFKSIQKDQNFDGDLQEFVDHYQAKQFANAFSVSIKDENVLDNNEDVWDVNTLIKAYSKTIGFDDAKEFLVNSLSFSFGKEQRFVILNCVLPETRTNELPEELPFL